MVKRLVHGARDEIGEGVHGPLGLGLEGGPGHELGGGQEEAEGEAGGRTEKKRETAGAAGAGHSEAVKGQDHPPVEDRVPPPREDHETEGRPEEATQGVAERPGGRWARRYESHEGPGQTRPPPGPDRGGRSGPS